jgi:quercetin dioxygenase-like cupin family protein
MAEHDAGEPLRELLGEVPGLRVQIVTLEPGQRIGWHRHTEVADTIVGVTGVITVETREPAARRRIAPGERMTLTAGTEHTVSGEPGATCRFINVHSDGAYDFVPR